MPESSYVWRIDVAVAATLWAKTPRARIAHLYTICEKCGGRGWLIGETYGLFGLAVGPEPCLQCGGSEEFFDNCARGGEGFIVACGYFSFSQELVEPAPDAERCRKCLERESSSG